MYRYLVFGGDIYYASGGINDFIGSYDTLDAAIEAALKKDDDWYHIFDSETKKVVDSSYNKPYLVPNRRLYANK